MFKNFNRKEDRAFQEKVDAIYNKFDNKASAAKLIHSLGSENDQEYRISRLSLEEIRSYSQLALINELHMEDEERNEVQEIIDVLRDGNIAKINTILGYEPIVDIDGEYEEEYDNQDQLKGIPATNKRSVHGKLIHDSSYRSMDMKRMQLKNSLDFHDIIEKAQIEIEMMVRRFQYVFRNVHNGAIKSRIIMQEVNDLVDLLLPLLEDIHTVAKGNHDLSTSFQKKLSTLQGFVGVIDNEDLPQEGYIKLLTALGYMQEIETRLKN